MARRNIADLDAVPESQWDAGDYIRRVYGVFPNFQISGIRGGHFLISQILPGPTPTTSTTIQTMWSRSEEHTSELQSLMRNSYAVFCLKKKKIVVQLMDTDRYNGQTTQRCQEGTMYDHYEY